METWKILLVFFGCESQNISAGHEDKINIAILLVCHWFYCYHYVKFMSVLQKKRTYVINIVQYCGDVFNIIMYNNKNDNIYYH